MNENIHFSLNLFIQANTRQATDACQKMMLRKSSPRKKLEFSCCCDQKNATLTESR